MSNSHTTNPPAASSAADPAPAEPAAAAPTTAAEPAAAAPAAAPTASSAPAAQSARKVVFLANPQARSGKGGALQQAALEELQRRDIALRVEQTHSPAELQAAAAKGASQGERVIVMGGDGSVHQAVNGVLASTNAGGTASTGTASANTGTEATLGIIAAGTGNDFARTMGLPVLSPKMRPAKAAGVIATAVTTCLSTPTKIDALRITTADETRWCASIATCGFPVFADNRAAEFRWLRGPSKYTIAALIEGLRLKINHYNVTIDGEQHEIAATLLAVANSPSFGHGYYIAPQASATDGLIDLIVIEPVSSFTLLRLLPATKAGKHVRHPAVKKLQGKVMEFLPNTAATEGADGAADNDRFQMRADGELIGNLPRKVEVVPGALHIAGAAPVPVS